MKKLMYAATAVLALALFFNLASKKGAEKSEQPMFAQNQNAPQQSGSIQSAQAQSQPGKNNSTQPGELPATKKLHAQRMVEVLSSFARPEKKLQELVDYLKQTEQEPKVFVDKQELIDDMYTIRTESPLKGTRYFHAQYFGEGTSDKAKVQHMSFEIQPSEESWQMAIDLVKQSFPDLGSIQYEKEDFIQWELPQGYAVSVKKLDVYDLSGHPMNAYTRGDIGTIRVTVEEVPEGH